MRAHFAAVQRILPPHPLLDEGVAGLALYGDTARRPHLLDRVPGQARVVDDFRARLPCQQGFRQQADQVITFDEPAAGVEEETAVEIAVPGQPQIGIVLPYCLRCGVPAFRQQGIGMPCGNVPSGSW